jgi:LysW-gamma-L-lysine carboxypeptidase
MNETLLGLVSHYSPSGSEKPAVDWLVGRMRALGYTQSFVDGAGNAVGVMGCGPRQVVLLGHIDTVPGELPVREDKGVLYGRGVVDAKGPLAAFVDAVAAFGEKEGWQFVVIGAVDEERDSCGARYVAAQYRPDFAVIGEPNHWQRVALGYKGVAWAELAFLRAQTHSASRNQTACETAFETWSLLRDYACQYNADKPRAFDQLLLTLRAIRSDENHLRQRAILQIDTRLPPAITPEQWYEQLRIFAGDAEIKRQSYAVPAWTCEKNTPLVRSFLSAIRSHKGTPTFVYKTGTADLNTVAPIWRCPALVYGPGDSALDHTQDERLSLEEYEQAVQVLADALTRLTVKSA